MSKTNNIFVKNLSFSYESERIFTDINFQLSTKNFIAIIGPNGGGKSTLLKLLLGILQPLKGEIKIFGKKPKDISLKLGYVPQNTNINKNFPIRVIDVVLQGRLGTSKKFWGYSKKDIEIAKEALKQTRSYEFLNKKIGELSGGQRQRVFISRALATKADILLLDEPAASIDAKGQIELYAILKELNKSKGIIVVSHDINISFSFANKVIYVNKDIFIHNSPSINKDKILKNIKNTKGHVCPVELMLNEEMCLHKQKDSK